MQVVREEAGKRGAATQASIISTKYGEKRGKGDIYTGEVSSPLHGAMCAYTLCLANGLVLSSYQCTVTPSPSQFCIYCQERNSRISVHSDSGEIPSAYQIGFSPRLSYRLPTADVVTLVMYRLKSFLFFAMIYV